MTDLHERLAIALVLVGVLLMGSLLGYSWLPLSANLNMPSHHSTQPALADWPRHDSGALAG